MILPNFPDSYLERSCHVFSISLYHNQSIEMHIILHVNQITFICKFFSKINSFLILFISILFLPYIAGGAPGGYPGKYTYLNMYNVIHYIGI